VPRDGAVGEADEKVVTSLVARLAEDDPVEGGATPGVVAFSR